MNKLELQKVANEVRKGIITGVHAAKQDIQVVLYPQQIFLHIYTLRR